MTPDIEKLVKEFLEATFPGKKIFLLTDDQKNFCIRNYGAAKTYADALGMLAHAEMEIKSIYRRSIKVGPLRKPKKARKKK